MSKRCWKCEAIIHGTGDLCYSCAAQPFDTVTFDHAEVRAHENPVEWLAEALSERNADFYFPKSRIVQGQNRRIRKIFT